MSTTIKKRFFMTVTQYIDHFSGHNHSPSFPISVTTTEKGPSCTSCTHFVQNSRICTRFYLYANYCRYDENKCGYEGRHWKPSD